jgi:hypothetical protein
MAILCGIVSVCKGCDKTDLTVSRKKRGMKRGLLLQQIYFQNTVY